MIEWVTHTLSEGGYFALLLLMALENVIPPIPSELIMPFAGFAAARGEMNLALAVLAGSAGSVLGSLPWYLVARYVGASQMKRVADRHGRWLTVTAAEMDAACAWFSKHGRKAVFLGRLVPAVRTLISVPAGLSAMPLGVFLLWSAAGTLVWTAFLAAAGFSLGQEYARVGAWLDPVAKAVLAVLVAVYLYRLATHGRRVRAAARK